MGFFPPFCTSLGLVRRRLQERSYYGLRWCLKPARFWTEGGQDGTPCSVTTHDHRGHCDACLRGICEDMWKISVYTLGTLTRLTKRLADPGHLGLDVARSFYRTTTTLRIASETPLLIWIFKSLWYSVGGAIGTVRVPEGCR